MASAVSPAGRTPWANVTFGVAAAALALDQISKWIILTAVMTPPRTSFTTFFSMPSGATRTQVSWGANPAASTSTRFHCGASPSAATRPCASVVRSRGRGAESG